MPGHIYLVTRRPFKSSLQPGLWEFGNRLENTQIYLIPIQTTTMTVVIELVRIPLAVSFDEFLDIFTKQLEPVLLAQRGIISILTGNIIEFIKDKENYAVSVTQWETLEAHGDFLASAAAKPFFDTLQPLARGPPAIEHYHMNPLDGAALRFEFAHISIVAGDKLSSLKSKFSQHVETNRNLLHFTGECEEVAGQQVSVLLSNQNNFGGFIDSDFAKTVQDAFTVAWKRSSLPSRLPSNL